MYTNSVPTPVHMRVHTYTRTCAYNNIAHWGYVRAPSIFSYTERMFMNLELIRGDTYKITFGITDVTNSPYVLQEGDKLYFTVKKSFNRSEFVLQKTESNGIAYDETSGKYQIKLTPICTCDLHCDDYVYDIKIKRNGDEHVKTLIKGKLSLVNNATHRCNE